MDTPRKSATFSARIAPAAGLDVLSRHEVARLRDAGGGGLHELLRRCALAVLTQGSATDDARALLERYPDFEIQILQQDRGVKLELSNAPADAFVDGRIIRGINELLFAVVRDIVYVATQIEAGRFDLSNSPGMTHAVFEILRNARVLRANVDPNLVVCWGGHSIPRDEYEYTKKVGYELGLRAFDICTGMRTRRDERPDERRHDRPRQAAAHQEPLHRHHRARHHRGGVAESDRQQPRDHAGHRETPRGVRAHGSRDHRVSGRRRHGRRNPVSARHPAAPGQSRSAVSADLHRARRIRRVFRADRSLPATRAR